MDQNEVVEALRDMYRHGPDVETVISLHACFQEAGDGITEDLPTVDQIEAGVAQLVCEGVLQRAGRNGYESTDAFIEQCEREDAL